MKRNDVRLAEEYSKAVKMIEIEFETAQVSGQLSPSSIQGVLGKLDELDAIERQNAEFRASLTIEEDLRQAGL